MANMRADTAFCRILVFVPHYHVHGSARIKAQLCKADHLRPDWGKMCSYVHGLAHQALQAGLAQPPTNVEAS